MCQVKVSPNLSPILRKLAAGRAENKAQVEHLDDASKHLKRAWGLLLQEYQHAAFHVSRVQSLLEPFESTLEDFRAGRGVPIARARQLKLVASQPGFPQIARAPLEGFATCIEKILED